MSISREVRKGKALLERSAEVTMESSSRDLGPWMLSCPMPLVTSVVKQWASAGVLRRSQVSTWRCMVSVTTTMNFSSSILVTVTSASIRPRSLSHWV